MYCFLIFVLSVLSVVLSKSGKIADWNRWAISQYFRAISSKNPDFMRVCGRTRLTETDRRNHVSNRRRENSKSGSPHGLVGSNPTASATSERVTLVPIFYIIKNQSPAPLFLLFRKKSRSARLFGCKRPHDGSLSLPTFCEFGSSTATAEVAKISFSCGLKPAFIFLKGVFGCVITRDS